MPVDMKATRRFVSRLRRSASANERSQIPVLSEFGKKRQYIAGPHLRKQSSFPGQVGNAAMMLHGLANNPSCQSERVPPSASRSQAAAELGGGLASTVWTQQPVDLATPNRERTILQSREGTVTFREAIGLDQWVRHIERRFSLFLWIRLNGKRTVFLTTA